MSEHKEEEAFETFVDIIAKLRGENGCPWDKEQTFESLKPCMVNEMTEALAGIDLYTQTGNAENLCEELGDVLMQVVLLSQIAREKGLFDITDVIKGISEKMIRRHPHVFGASGLGSDQAAGKAAALQRAGAGRKGCIPGSSRSDYLSSFRTLKANGSLQAFMKEILDKRDIPLYK